MNSPRAQQTAHGGMLSLLTSRRATAVASHATQNLLPPSAAAGSALMTRPHTVTVDAEFVTCTQ